MTDRLWITWEVQRRNRSLSRQLGARLVEITSRRNRLLRYPYQLLRTLLLLFRERPKILFVQNPSILLALSAIILRRMTGVECVIMDAHNAGIYPLEGRSRLLNTVARYIFRRVDITIVTNLPLADYVRVNGGNPVVMPDPLPEFAACDTKRPVADRRLSAVFISTWSSDEPCEELISAAKYFQGSVFFSITGTPPARFRRNELPGNVALTGYLKEVDYLDLLRNADLIIVLTRRENCLNCGAYEAVALGKPLILSDTPILRNYFNTGVVHTNNDPDSIRDAIRSLLPVLPEKARRIRELAVRLEEDWGECLQHLEHAIGQCRSHSG